jgi:hypothetical protein
VKNLLLPALSFSIFCESFLSIASWQLHDDYACTTSIRKRSFCRQMLFKMCVLILQRVKVMWLKYAQKTTSRQGGGGVGLRQGTTNNTDCPFRITAWKNGDGGWGIATIVADHNHDGTEAYVP